MNSWDDLSIREKAEMMKVAIRNGITSLPDIKDAYNEFAEGGNLYGDGSYLSKAKSLIKRHEGWRSTPYKDAPKGKSWRSVGYGFNDSGFYERYPEGISKHYEKGITKAQAEQELDYYLGKAERTLRGIYGKHWDSFNDNQKAAIFDTYYQRPASVGKGSAFYNAVKSGRDATKYLGVSGYAGRNKDRQSVFGGGATPAVAENIEVTLPQEMSSQPMITAAPAFTPMNPQVFGMQMPSYQSPVVVPEQPIIVMAEQPTPTPEQLERQRIMQERAEQRDALNRFGLLMSMSNPQQGNDMMGAIGMLAGLSNGYRSGGDIHIKPSHRGRFTRLKERTGHSASWFKEHGTPAQKKMATFELNARKWKHDLGGNLFETGGPEKKWKALDNIDFVAIPDTSFTRDKTGMGSIEYFDAKFPEGITYPNGYHREHPLPGKDVILYNPNDNDGQDVRLDALHIMPKDATYDALNTLYRNAALDSDVSYNAKAKYNEDAERYGKDNIDSYEQYFNNEADGLLRNMFIEGTPEYIEGKRYYPNKSELRKWNTGLLPYIDAIQNYLVTGERPANILPEVTIIEKRRKSKKHGYGGNLYDGASQPSQQMDVQPNIFRYSDGRFVYQANPKAEEIPVTPINTLLSDPAQWTYQDAEGRIYTPHVQENAQVGTGTLTEAEDTNPLMRAANNYVRELEWRAKNDPSSIALHGKYTLPIALSPILGKAAATALANPYVDAGITSAFAGHGLNHAINEGIDGWGDAAMTALEITPLGRLFKPAFEMGYSAAKPIFNKAATSLQNNYPALFDPYTSWDATLGYHGDNIFSRAIGTVGRRFGYTPKAEIPEFHRRLNITKPESFRLTDDGKFIMSSGRTGEGHEGIVNFATSEPARSHNKHKYLSGVDDFIVSPKAFEGVDFKSIQPSDTFFETPLSNTEFTVDPKYITFVSGEPTALDFARSIGMKTLSSPRLRALEADGPTFSGLLSRINNFKGAHSEHARSIGNEIQRLTSMRGAPTMQDYAHFEDMTGLNSGIVPASQWTGTNAIDLFGRESGVRGVPIFNNVAYDPATSIESIYRKAKTGEGTWEAYYDALEKMPSARQQLGLNSAQWTEATAPQITAENAANITPIPNNSSIRYAGSAKEDYSNSGYGLLDYLRNDKINAFLQGKPFYESDLGSLGVRKEEFPADWTITKMPFSDEAKEIINNSAKPRILAQAEKDIRDLYDPVIDGPDIEKYVKDELSYIEKQLDAKINEGYELGSDALFKAYDKGKTATRTGGLQLTNDGRIVLREGKNPEEFAVHEWEHRRTNGNIGGSHYGNEKRLLRKAFTKEFRELSETVPDFKGMNMDDEMVTTVSDTREVLLGKTHLRKTALDLQNKMIDKSSDEKVFAAVEKANAYGSFYIKKMRELGKLTPELAQNIREALKHVGGYAIPTAIAAGTLYGKQE